jgi:hypothetical protein
MARRGPDKISELEMYYACPQALDICMERVQRLLQLLDVQARGDLCIATAPYQSAITGDCKLRMMVSYVQH